jgi:hypothetical protein
MMFTDPLFLITFFGGLAVAFLIARGIRRFIDRRKARRFVRGPDTRSRQVRRAHRRQARKVDRR